MEKLSLCDAQDLLLGCAALGTGGGGALAEGLSLLERAAQRGEFVLADLDEVPDDDLIASPYTCGAVSRRTPQAGGEPAAPAQAEEYPALRAFRALQDHLGKPLQGVISTELGGGNTAKALYVAAMEGLYVIDGDPAGRAVPELQHSMFFVHGLPITPMAVATRFGDCMIVTAVGDELRAEVLVRAVAVASNDEAWVVDHPTRAVDLRGVVIPRALSHALAIGRELRAARLEQRNAASAVAQAGGGFVCFCGNVQSVEWQNSGGFTVGEVLIQGEGPDAGSSYRISFKNENLIAWRDEEVDITVPDLICVIDDDTGEPLANPDYRPRSRVSVVGLPAPPQWRTTRGIEVFGPRHFGFDVDYRPLVPPRA